ncbi:MAG: hypothetical protein AAB368_13640, partial [bacterium]
MRLAWLPVLLALLGASGYAASSPSVEDINAVSDAYLQGYRASATEADAWEAALARDPNQPAVRERLIGWCSHRRFKDGNARDRLAAHVMFVIGHYPASPYASAAANMYLFSGVDGAVLYEPARKAWLAAVAAQPADGNILLNAASFLELEDRATSEKLLKQGMGAEPKNPAWHERLGQLYLRQTLVAEDAGAKYASASKALQELERASALMPTEDERLQIMGEDVKSSYMVDRTDKTTDYATRWLKEVPVGRWDYANAQH